jgi:hypothetical protein
MTRLTLLLIFFTATTFGQGEHDRLLGTYESTSNGFERYSVVILNKGHRFIYKSGLGGCQVQVTGTWAIENKKLKFTNDKAFLDNDTIHYPNLALTTWTIRKLGIKPDKKVDGGCMEDDKLHRRK